ncbi:MAG: TetR/AcrR family transcriptional regulator [Bacteroidetes bacterium]|nr:TetR/AcrR family transcriptional regulator [Bacteroidota bacterium]
MEKKKQHIISESIQLFLKFGVKSLTMEDIARKLGISKKTLYTHVKDKEDLLLQAVILFGKYEDKQLNEICSRGLNAIVESLEIKKWVLDMIQNIHPSVAYDIEKFHPAVSKRMKTSRHENVYRSIFQNIVKGQKEGLYRSDINADILAKLYIGRMESIFDQELFPSTTYNVSDVYMEWFIYHIHGMATSKGLRLLENNFKNNKTKTRKSTSK